MALLARDEIVRLTASERLELIGQLWDSLDHAHLPLSGSQKTELESRLSKLKQHRRDGITWAALKAELEQRLP